MLEEDPLPKKICTDCCSTLDSFSRYKDAVLDAQEKLSAIAKSLQSRSHDAAPQPQSSPEVGEKSPVMEYDVSPINNDESSSRIEEESENDHVLQCGICGHPAESREDLKAHHGRSHDKEKHPKVIYGCSFCPRISSNYNALRLHIYRHLKDDGNPKKDNKEIDNNSKPGRRKKSNGEFHSDEEPTGELLGAPPIPVVDNMEEVVDEGPASALSNHDAPSPPSSKEDDNTHTDENCRIQGQGSSGDSETAIRSQSHGGSESERSGSKPVDDPGTWKCEYCNKQYETKRGYDFHVAMHIGKRYECEHCDKTFTQKVIFS